MRLGKSDIDRFANLSDDELEADCWFDAGDIERRAIRRELKRREAEREVNAELERLQEPREESEAGKLAGPPTS